MKTTKPKLNRAIFSWALYDWANSAFATTVMAGFFPLFFKQYWSAGTDSTVSTFQLGVGNTIAGIAIVVLAPVLGAIADKAGVSKRSLLIFASIGMLFTSLLFTVDKGDWLLAIVCYCVATVGFMGANIFYDALIVSVAEPHERHWISALGYSLGYLGGGILFSINVAMTLTPEIFGITNAAHAVRLSFISVAVWWALFSIPLFLYVKEVKMGQCTQGFSSIKAGVQQVLDTLSKIRLIKNIWIFLLAYWLYIDGVDTIVRMAVDYGLAIGMEQNDLIVALLITQFVGFPAALVFGYLGHKIGPKNGLYIGISIYIVIIIWAALIEQAWEFYVLAVAIGLVQGGVQALSRSLYASLIPIDKASEFFGFYNMLGKFATVLGPFMVGLLSLATGNHRVGLLSILILFILGALLLRRVEDVRTQD